MRRSESVLVIILKCVSFLRQRHFELEMGNITVAVSMVGMGSLKNTVMALGRRASPGTVRVLLSSERRNT